MITWTDHYAEDGTYTGSTSAELDRWQRPAYAISKMTEADTGRVHYFLSRCPLIVTDVHLEEIPARDDDGNVLKVEGTIVEDRFDISPEFVAGRLDSIPYDVAEMGKVTRAEGHLLSTFREVETIIEDRAPAMCDSLAEAKQVADAIDNGTIAELEARRAEERQRKVAERRAQQ